MWLRRLLRWLAISSALVALLAVVLVGGFRLWLSQQPDEVRAGLESEGAMTPSPPELARMLWHLIAPPDQESLADFGRRSVPGRGHAPWVLRSSLDGRPRMLQLALAPEHWASYATELGSLYQFWRGELHLSGAVYDTRHGPEPESRGLAFLRAPDRVAWGWLAADGRLVAATVRPLGHRLSDAGARATLRFRLTAPDGPEQAVVEETPEIVLERARTGLRRSFRVERSAAPGERRLVLSLAPAPGAVDTVASLLSGDRVVLEPGASELIQWFAAPGIAIPERLGEASGLVGAAALFEASDCRSCHGEHERISGPADVEIARRYAREPREETVDALARTVIAGGVGRWGSVPMPAHPTLTRVDARTLVRAMLDRRESEDDAARPGPGADPGTWVFDVEPRPATLHPALRLRPLRLEGFTPKVGGLAWLPDGRLGVVTWDPDGSLFAVDGWQEGSSALSVERLADGLHEPLGLEVVGDDVFVLQKQELTRLVDRDRDGVMDDYQTLSQAWSVTSNFHEFGFGLVHRAGWLYGALSVCVLPGGKSCPQQTADRGTVFRVSLEDGRFERLASGFRTPNGVGELPGGGLLVTDNQGDWLPASKLVQVVRGGFYGWRPPAEAALPRAAPLAPVVWLPQNEVGNSPTEPIVLRHGPYRGQVLFGDVYNGGLKRVSLQSVGEVLQGAAFHFTGGLAGGVNRLLESPQGEVVVGEIGSTGNWGETGKGWHGLEVLRFEGEAAFEPLTVEVTAWGLDLHFTRPLARGAEPQVRQTRLQQWRYEPTLRYGGPKLGLRDLRVAGVELSDDRRRAHLDVEGLTPGHVVYLRLDRGLASVDGDPLWVNEAWVTVNAIPDPPIAAVPAGDFRP